MKPIGCAQSLSHVCGSGNLPEVGSGMCCTRRQLLSAAPHMPTSLAPAPHRLIGCVMSPFWCGMTQVLETIGSLSNLPQTQLDSRRSFWFFIQKSEPSRLKSRVQYNLSKQGRDFLPLVCSLFFNSLMHCWFCSCYVSHQLRWEDLGEAYLSCNQLLDLRYSTLAHGCLKSTKRLQ